MSNNHTYQTHKETPEGRALTIERRARRNAQRRYGDRVAMPR